MTAEHGDPQTPAMRDEHPRTGGLEAKTASDDERVGAGSGEPSRVEMGNGRAAIAEYNHRKFLEEIWQLP